MADGHGNTDGGNGVGASRPFAWAPPLAAAARSCCFFRRSVRFRLAERCDRCRSVWRPGIRHSVLTGQDLGTFRVASAARRASAMPAICVSRTSTGCPLFRRVAARTAASVAAALSKSKTRFSKSSFSKRANAVSSVCRRRSDGSKARPKCASNNVMLVIHTESAGWRSSHATMATSRNPGLNASALDTGIQCSSATTSKGAVLVPSVPKQNAAAQRFRLNL
jgi:hypothetical protein